MTPEYKKAIDTFLLEAEVLTDADIAVLQSVDDLLAARATAKRRDCQSKAAATRHRKAMGEPQQKRNSAEQMADSVIDHLRLALAPERQRIKSLEGANAVLQQHVQDLRARLLELEASRAVAEQAHGTNANH